MLAETGMALAYDDLPKTAGQVTTAEAMGDALLDRLQKAGITFTVVGRRESLCQRVYVAASAAVLGAVRRPGGYSVGPAWFRR
jgi:hypothetical protein